MTNTITDTDRLTFLAKYFFFEHFGVGRRLALLCSSGDPERILREKLDELIVEEQSRTVIIRNSELEDLRAKAAEADKLAALLQDRDAQIAALVDSASVPGCFCGDCREARRLSYGP